MLAFNTFNHKRLLLAHCKYDVFTNLASKVASSFLWPPHFLMKFGNSSYSVIYRKICREFDTKPPYY